MTTPILPSALLRKIFVFFAIFSALVFPFLPGAFAQDSSVGQGGFPVAKDGAAQTRIFIAPEANEELTATANVLSATLERISGAAVPISTEAWNGGGILLALREALPEAESAVNEVLKALPLESYAINVTPQRAMIVGNSPKSLQDGTYALLEQLGCRWLIPSERWTVIPKQATLHLPAQETVSTPDYFYRSIWYAYGIGNMGEPIADELKAAYDRWCDANRLGGVTKYKVGHTYASTVGRHKAEFEAHPEYFALDKDGARLPFQNDHQSLCYSNPRIAELFIEDKLAELTTDKEANPNAYTVSMDPNDGSVECFCEDCQKLGNGSDQVLYLANKVARALREKYPDAVVAFYAYASHRLPPEKVDAEPNVQIQVAMGFNKTQYTLEQLVALWRKKIDSVGIRDYFGVMAWDWGLPGRGKSSSFSYVKDNIPRYYDWGARAFNAETNANWGTFGPASYLATQLLWNVKADADAIYDDYFISAFGKAAGDMKAFYAMFAENQDLSRQNLHDWLEQLNKAMETAKGEDQGVQERLADLAAYLHYVVLYRDWELALESDDQEKAYAALKPLLEFTWQIRSRNIVHAYALQRRLVNSGHPKIRPLREGWKFNDPDAVWRNSEVLTDPQILAIFEKDLAANPADKRLRKFSSTLRPSGESINDEAEEIAGFFRYESVWHVLVEKDTPLEFKLPMTGVKSEYKLEIFDAQGTEVWDSAASVGETESRYATKSFEMDVKFPSPGQYKLVFSAGEDYKPHFPAELKAVMEMSLAHSPMLRAYGPGYFYVPAGTENILVKTDGRFSVTRPGETIRTDYSGAENDPTLECLSIPVEGADAQFWTMTSSTSGRNHFLNIPPYIATDPGRLLIPEDADSN